MLGLGFGLLSWFTDGSGGPYSPFAVGTPPRVISETGWINRVAVERLGMRLVRATNWMSSGATAGVETLQTPGLTGGRVQPLRSTQPLVITLEGNFLEVSTDDRIAAANLVADALRGLLEIRFADAPDRVIRGVAGPIQFAPLTDKFFVPSKRASAVKATIPITCVDSARYALQPRQLVIDQTPTPVRLGSLASGGDYYVLGPYTGDLDIDCIAPTGQRVYRLALRDIDIPDEGYAQIRLDAPHAILVYDDAGEATSVAEWRDLTLSSRWWKLAPFYAHGARGQYPMLRQSAGFGLYRYHEAWEH